MAHNGLRYGAQKTARRHGAHDSALDVSKDEVAHMRMRELEEENGLLLEKATSASQRFVDYENQIRVLQQQVKLQEQRLATNAATPPPEPAADSGLSRLGSFMRRPAATATATPSPTVSSAREQELEKSLAKEQKARAAAEQKTKQVNAEVEELSTTLFQQANEMVATERRQVAALKAQIKELQKAGGKVAEVVGKENARLKERLQVMEQRDAERQKRLERLEAAQKRIDRVRTMLMPR